MVVSVYCCRWVQTSKLLDELRLHTKGAGLNECSQAHLPPSTCRLPLASTGLIIHWQTPSPICYSSRRSCPRSPPCPCPPPSVLPPSVAAGWGVEGSRARRTDGCVTHRPSNTESIRFTLSSKIENESKTDKTLFPSPQSETLEAPPQSQCPPTLEGSGSPIAGRSCLMRCWVRVAMSSM